MKFRKNWLQSKRNKKMSRMFFFPLLFENLKTLQSLKSMDSFLMIHLFIRSLAKALYILVRGVVDLEPVPRILPQESQLRQPTNRNDFGMWEETGRLGENSGGTETKRMQ